MRAEKKKPGLTIMFIQALQWSGAKWGTRTPDLLITNQLLYQLS